jgi:thiamine pyrophosphate-dependent acetolactate synthase large subunit-like protein
MNTGALCTLGNERPPNVTEIIFDNGVYESIGGPPTHSGRRTDLALMAAGAGCINCVTATTLDEFRHAVEKMLTDDEFGLLVAKIEPGLHPWTAAQRKPTDGIEDKYRFIRYVERLEGIVIHASTPQH